MTSEPDRAAWRPRYHVTGERNWVNDPNGPIHHGGRHHLFFQANERAPVWGRPSWGHVSSEDLVTWDRHPVALQPGRDGPDAGGCWSGCTRIVDGRPAIYYTGVVGEGEGRVESVCRAWGSADLLRWERDRANPLITGPPSGRDCGHHRDPFLWRDSGRWQMLLGSGAAGHGQVLRYESADAEAWAYRGVFFEAPRELDGIHLGEHWECPQLVLGAGAEAALVVSCALPGAERPLMHAVAFTGTIRDGRLDARLAGLLDHGDVLYAPAVLQESRGEALLWGWAQERLDPHGLAAVSHAGALTLPRRATLRDGTLRVVLAEEVARLRRCRMTNPAGPQMELVAAVAGDRGRAGWALSDAVRIVIDAERSRLTVTVDGRQLTAPLVRRERHELRVLVDGSLLEVFADAEVAITTRAYPRHGWGAARLAVEGGARVDDAQCWRLASARSASNGA